jgi:hypothetical protein
MTKQDAKLKIVYKQVKDLIPYARNSRTHSEAQLSQIAASIKEFGFTQPILLDGENGIIAGHGRWQAAFKLAMHEVPTIDLSHLTDLQKQAYVIADNKLALNSGWDEEMLKVELTDLKNVMDLDITGFSAFEVNSIFDEENNPDEEWKGMPEFNQQDKTSFRHVIVHFENNDDAAEFFSIIGQGHTDKTKSIWYPEQQNMDTESKRYE